MAGLRAQSRRNVRVEKRHEPSVLCAGKLAILLQNNLQLVRMPGRFAKWVSMKPRQIIAALLALATLTTLFWGVPVLMRRAHAEEAILNLARLTRISDVYYVKPKLGANGERMVCQFPVGELRSTLAKSCCDPSVNDGHGRCDPAKIEWNRSLWKTLKFKMDEPHWFVYEIKATGTLADATLEVSAYGDADCDGHYSTFRFTHHGDSAARLDNCVLNNQPEFVAIDPQE